MYFPCTFHMYVVLQTPVSVWSSTQKPLTATSAASVTSFCTHPNILVWKGSLRGVGELCHVEVTIHQAYVTVVMKVYLHIKVPGEKNCS